MFRQIIKLWFWIKILRIRFQLFLFKRRLLKLLRNSRVPLEHKENILSHLMTRVTGHPWSVLINYDGSVECWNERILDDDE